MSASPAHSRPNSPPHKRVRVEGPQAHPITIEVDDFAEGSIAPIASTSSIPRPQPKPLNSKFTKKKKKNPPPPEPGTAEDVNLHDVYSALGEAAVREAVESRTEYDAPVELFTEMELVVKDICSHGDAICLLSTSSHSPKPWAVLVPFALPGEVVVVRIYRHAKLHSYADLVRVVTPNSELRDDSRIKCKYFGTCGGCQYQMVSYETQLAFKKRVVEKAYDAFFKLDRSLLPPVLDTMPSPKQYEYRTKLTPHFDAAPRPKGSGKGKGKAKRKVEGIKADEEGAYEEDTTMTGAEVHGKPWAVRIGFDQKGRRTVMDIEECPIATPVVNEGYALARKEVQKNIMAYKKGATLLFRDSLPITTQNSDPLLSPPSNSEIAASKVGFDNPLSEKEGAETHICITSHKATVRERVGQTLFDFPAGSFFQNNNSVLAPLTDYVRDAIFGPPPSSSPSINPPPVSERKKPTHLVDTYCGSGLFAITLSPYFQHVAGIEIDTNAIKFVKHNLSLNKLDTPIPGVDKPKHAFHAGKSEDIFASVLRESSESFPPDDTVVVIDPPRKGCDESFIDQLVNFAPSMLVYVSCNVHTQARDVGWIINKMDEKLASQATLSSSVEGVSPAPGVGTRQGSYYIESLRGFDLFPQTAHVESVAVLRRR